MQKDKMKKTILTIIAIFVIAAISGGGIYLWQRSLVKELNFEKQALQNQIELLGEVRQEQSSKDFNEALSGGLEQIAKISSNVIFKTNFLNQELNELDKNTPYYNIIMSNANKRLGRVIRTDGIDITDMDSESKEDWVFSHSTTNDGYLFIIYGMWSGSRLAKIDLRSEKLVAEYYHFRHCDTVCPFYPGIAICYYKGDKNKVVFYDNPTIFDEPSDYYQYWDLKKTSVRDNELSALSIKNETELINNCQ